MAMSVPEGDHHIAGINAPVGDGFDLGEVTVYSLTEGWVPVVNIGDEEASLKPHETPGAAVDAAYKWAKDRGLILTFPTMVIRRKP